MMEKMTNYEEDSIIRRLIQGRILRKKKYRQEITLAVKESNNSGDDEGQPAVVVHLPKSLQVPQHCLFLQSTVSVVVSMMEQQNYSICGLVVQSIELIRAAPDPHSVASVLAGIRGGALSPRTLLPADYNLLDDGTTCEDGDDEPTSRSSSNSSISLENSHRNIAQIVKRLQGNLDTHPRHRPPRTKRADLQILEAYEKSCVLRPLQEYDADVPPPEEEEESPSPQNVEDTKNENSTTTTTAAAATSLCNVPDDCVYSAHGKLTRREYLDQKKHPQIAYMVERCRKVLLRQCHHHRGSNNQNIPKQQQQHHIVDIGGGRGDLAVALAQAFPTYQITVIDMNERSLLAAQSHAETVGVDNIRFVAGCLLQRQHQLFPILDENNSSSSSATAVVDLVVALHACGDLSDAALQFAHSRSSSFVICPCCYSKRDLGIVPIHLLQQRRTDHDNHDNKKREELATIGRLAELEERRDLSRRAMHVINSLRLNSIIAEDNDGGYRKVALEVFDSAISSRNMVLVGERLNTTS